MSEFPEDVLEEAREAAITVHALSGLSTGWQIRIRRGLHDVSPEVQSAARAILAERERCAQIAEQMGAILAGVVTADGFCVGPNAPHAIAAAIRASKEGKP